MARPGRKSTSKAAIKNTAVEAEKNSAAKTEVTAKPVESPKPVETKTEYTAKAVKKTGKTASEKAEKSASKKAPAKKAAPEAAAPKKRAPRKPKVITVDDVVAKISKRIDKTAAAQLVPNGKAAVDIKLYGPFEAHMYIEIKDGAVNVAPYDYIEKDIEAAIPVDVALAIADGKTTVKEAVENGSLYVFGNVQFALMFAKLFK